MFRRIAETILVLKWPLLLIFLLLTLLMGIGAFRLRIDPSMETLFIKSSPEYQYYREYKARFGSDEMVAVAIDTPDLFTIERLTRLTEISKKIAKFDPVERVLSLATAMDIKHKFLGVKIVPALEGVLEGERSLEEAKADILSNKLYLNNLVSPNGRIGNILIYLQSPDKKLSSSGEFLEDLKKLLAGFERLDFKFYMAGSPVEQYEFIKLIQNDQMTFVPLITVLLVVTTLMIYRSIACMVLSMSIVLMTLVWTLGSISFLGQELNLMTSLLGPVIMIIAVVNSIYLMNLFFELRPHHPSLRRSVVLTIEQLGLPSFLTHMTTALGFLSLAIDPVPAIKSFGIFASLGTFYSYIIEIVMTTILLPILPYRRVTRSFDESKFFNRVIIGFIEKLDFQWKWLILIGTIVTLGFSFKGISKIKVDTNIVKQMKPSLPLAISTRFIDENLTGVYSLGFVLRRKNNASFEDPQTLQQVDAFVEFLEAMPEIPKVNSITTVLKKIHQAKEGEDEAFVIPEDKGLLRRYFDGLATSEDPEVWNYISHDFKEMRLEARMKAVGTTEGAAVEAAARRYLEEKLGRILDYNVTGNVVLLGQIAKQLVDQQITSFSLAFGSILIIIILIFRSVVLGLFAAIPNLIPILAVYGIAGFVGIELSTPTAMIASIVLGMVVDAAIQFLYRFRLEFNHRHHYLQALHHTFRNMGQSMVVSTTILMAGFGSSVFSSFRPTVHFGVMTSLAIFFALLCTLIVLPSWIVMFKPFGKERLFKRPANKGGFQEVPIAKKDS